MKVSEISLLDGEFLEKSYIPFTNGHFLMAVRNPIVVGTSCKPVGPSKHRQSGDGVFEGMSATDFRMLMAAIENLTPLNS